MVEREGAADKDATMVAAGGRGSVAGCGDGGRCVDDGSEMLIRNAEEQDRPIESSKAEGEEEAMDACGKKLQK